MLIGFEQINLNDVEAYNPLNNRSRSPDNVSICYKYTSCPLDLTFDTLEEALAQGTFNKHHVKGECWINSLIYFYGDTSLNPDKKKNIITKLDVLKIINKTEAELKEGLSVEDVKPFFLKSSLSACGC